MRTLPWFGGGMALMCLGLCLGLPLDGALVCAAAPTLFSLGLWLGARPRPPFELPPLKGPMPRRFRLWQFSRRTLALGVGCLVGAGWMAGYTALFRLPALALVGEEVTLIGTVLTTPQTTTSGGRSLVVRLEEGYDVMVYAQTGWEGVRLGDQITCLAQVEPSNLAFGEESTYYTAQGIFLVAFPQRVPQRTTPDQLPLICWPARAGELLGEGIDLAFDQVTAPLARAVTLGDKKGLEEGVYTALSRSGVLHATVVSGLHISFLVGVTLTLCQGRRRVALGCIPLLIFYALMVGGTPSAFRAVVMQGAMVAAPVLGREHDSPSGLGLALVVLLFQNPYAAASVSLQLSFLSVAGILLFARPLYGRMAGEGKKRETRLSRIRGRVRRFLAASLSTSLGAMALSQPVVALSFGQISLAAPVTNLLVLTAVSALMICALGLGLLALVLPGPAALLGMGAGLLGRYVLWVTGVLGGLPWAAVDAHNPYWLIWLVGVYLAGAAALIFRPLPLSGGVAALVLLAGAAWGLNRYTLMGSDLLITALDVGQGSCTLFCVGDKTMVVDCGGDGAVSAGDRAADQLAALGLDRVDVLVFTHLDADHFNGSEELFARVEVGQVWAPVSEAGSEELALLEEWAGEEVHLVEEELALPLGEATVTLYPPLGSGTSNEEGLFVCCTLGEFDTLITGDADSFVERMLIKYFDLPDIELLMVGHHGSEDSTSTRLLNWTLPELAIISVGANSYGHPAPETLERLEARGTRVYRTDLDGSVTVGVRGDQVAIW